MRKQVRLLISGLVQGVFFRMSASHEARQLKLTGLARNLSDGSVEVLAEGEEETLNRLIDWCKKGPPGARVKQVKISWGEATDDLTSFQIR